MAFVSIPPTGGSWYPLDVTVTQMPPYVIYLPNSRRNRKMPSLVWRMMHTLRGTVSRVWNYVFARRRHPYTEAQRHPRWLEATLYYKPNPYESLRDTYPEYYKQVPLRYRVGAFWISRFSYHDKAFYEKLDQDNPAYIRVVVPDWPYWRNLYETPGLPD